MSKTNAERQAEYRKRQQRNADESQINMYLPVSQHIKLRRIAKFHGKTFKQWLCDIADEFDEKILSELEPDSDEFFNYIESSAEKEKQIDELILKPDRYIWKCPACDEVIEAQNQSWLTRYKNKHICKRF